MTMRAVGSDQRRQRCRGGLSDGAANCRAPAMACGVLAFALASFVAGAALAATRDGDPLHSPECVHARAELDAALAARDARGSARLQRAREQALQACLGQDTGRRQRSGAPDPVRAVAPTIAPEPPRAVLPVAPARAAPPPVDIPRPAVITNCEPGGCWDSQGRRFDRAGPLLIGPNGCQAQGGLVTCP